MTRKKKTDAKKSLSVNDIPVERHPQDFIQDLDDSSFTELLNRVSCPLYSRKSEGTLNMDSGDSTGIVPFLEKALRDEDSEKERQKEREESPDPRRPPSVSPTFVPPARRYPANTACFNTLTDMEFIDDGDVEMEDLSHIQREKGDYEITKKGDIRWNQYKKANVEQVCNELTDDSGDMPSPPSFADRDDEQKEDFGYQDPMGRGSYNLSGFNGPQYGAPRNNVLNTDGLGAKMSLGSSDCMSDTSIGSIGSSDLPVDNTDNRNPFVYGPPPRFPIYPPFDVHFAQKGHQTLLEKEREPQSERAKEIKKRIERRKQKEQAGWTTVQAAVQGTEWEVDKIVSIIDHNESETKNEDGPQERRRKSKDTKKSKLAAATIGNQHGKAPAAAPSNKPQNSTAAGATTTTASSAATSAAPTSAVAATNMSKDNNKKSPNKKNKKGAAGSSATAASSSAAAPASTAPPPARVAGRTSAEDAEEEFLSADEGVVANKDEQGSAVSGPASEVMIDGGNYRADADDLSYLENHVAEEQEFITVGSRDKKKKGSVGGGQPQRTGSTGKVERRGTQVQQQQNSTEQQARRNSMEDRRPRPQAAASLGDYFDEKKHDAHHKAKLVPFKESKKRHQERLESTADSEYLDATDEMSFPAPTPSAIVSATSVNGTTTPERTFSYADAAKKSAEQSRENSPACVNQPNGTPPPCEASPSPPPPAISQQPVTETVAPSSSSSTPSKLEPSVAPSSAAAGEPVSMPEDAAKTDAATTGISFFYDEAAGSNNAEEAKDAAASDAGDASNDENKDFVLTLGTKTVRFAMGMAAPVSAEPVDERHRASIDMMLQRWQMFISQGPTPVYYTPQA